MKEPMQISSLQLKTLIELKENDFRHKFGNDFLMMSAFDHIIVQCVKIVFDFRYCSNPECKCSPEAELRKTFSSLTGEDILKELESISYSDIKGFTKQIRSLLNRK
ncbi:hypothetical protein ACYSNU_17710 [Enterococcus sp. LJL120]